MSSPFPAAHSILSPEALARRVLPEYGLGEVEEVRFFQPGFNDTYAVRTREGRAYFLRAYRHGWRTRDDALCELDALDHLHRKGVSVAYPLPRKAGGFLSEIDAPEGPRFIAVFVEAKGREVSYDGDPVPAARQYGAAVAAMHNALDDFTSPHPRFRIDLAHLIDTPLERVAPRMAHRPEDWGFIERFAHAVRRAIVGLPESALEIGFCHGDLQGYHAHADSAGMLTFYDFDCGGFGYRAYDLAVFRWCARLQDQEADRWPAFLEAYRAARAVGDLDVVAVPLFVCARHIWHMGVHAENAPDWGYGGLNDAYYDGRIERLRALRTDYGIDV